MLMKDYGSKTGVPPITKQYQSLEITIALDCRDKSQENQENAKLQLILQFALFESITRPYNIMDY